MNSSIRFILLLAALAVAAGGVIEARRLVAAQRADLRAAEARVNSVQAECHQLDIERDALQRELAAAVAQLASLPPPLDANERTRELEIRAWLGRMNRLRQLFKDHPDQAIPELRLLSDVAWLVASRKVDFSDDAQMRKALAAIRGAAERTFANQTFSAVRKYMRETNGEKPTTVLALAPYFDTPPDFAMLQRYELVTLEQRNRNGFQGWALQSATPVDADYDSRQQITSTGSMAMMTAPTAWIPNYRERSAHALQDYVAANHGPPPLGTAPLIPYFNPPLEPALVDKILRAEREQQR